MVIFLLLRMNTMAAHNCGIISYIDPRIMWSGTIAARYRFFIPEFFPDSVGLVSRMKFIPAVFADMVNPATAH
jgi:hypothetical protein